MLEMIIGNGVYVSLILLFVIIILLRVFYALAVNSNAKRRDLDNPVFWTAFSVLFGLPAFLMFFAINARQGKQTEADSKRKTALTVMFVFIICLCVAFVPLRAKEVAKDYSLYSGTIVYKINPVKYVAYDKKGKAYSVVKFDTRRWMGYFGMPTDSIYVPTYYQDGKVVEELGAFVNSDGYAVRDFNKDEYENRVYEKDNLYLDLYFGADGSIYYHDYNCSWDKDGNLIIVGLNEELTRDNTVLYDDYAVDDEMNGFHNYSYYDSIDNSDKSQ